MAKLPSSLVRTKQNTLQDLPVEATGYVELAAMQIDSDLNCYLNPNVVYEAERNIMRTIEVTRKTEGLHVALLVHWTWEPAEKKFDLTHWLPVATLIERYDPKLDRY